MNILGISAFYHDSAACLLQNGEIIAAAQEERFTRKKHDATFPNHAVAYCLEEGGIGLDDIDIVVFYEKPFLKFERILSTYLAYAPRSVRSFITVLPLWMKEKIWMKDVIKRELGYDGEILFTEHHEAHASSAFFASPFQHAAFLTIDGVGEWATTTFGVGKDNTTQTIAEMRFPHSLGLLYSAFTYYTGFKVNSGEYKMMGLAPYGTPCYKDIIYSELIDLKKDGSFKLNMRYFDFCTGLTMVNRRFEELFGGPARKPDAPLTQHVMDIAKSIQEVTDEIIMRMVQYVYDETHCDSLCLAGGVALNCVSNGKVLKEGPFEHIWIQPAASDAGGAIGAALAVWYRYLKNPRKITPGCDAMRGAYLGPSYSDEEIKDFLDSRHVRYHYFENEDIFFEKIATLLSEEKVIGWFQGRMEFGPRALGNRSIIGDARSPRMQSIMNLKIKFRESFRPFAPSVLREKVQEYFELNYDSPYMLLVASVCVERRSPITPEQEKLRGIERLNISRSDIPAVTHVDYSARIQTVHKETNPRYWKLLEAFEKKIGCSVIVNTSFNVRGEPIVCALIDAYLCFMRTEMDYLAMGNFLLDKKEMLMHDTDWGREFSN